MSEFTGMTYEQVIKKQGATIRSLESEVARLKDSLATQDVSSRELRAVRAELAELKLRVGQWQHLRAIIREEEEAARIAKKRINAAQDAARQAAKRLSESIRLRKQYDAEIEGAEARFYSMYEKLQSFYVEKAQKLASAETQRVHAEIAYRHDLIRDGGAIAEWGDPPCVIYGLAIKEDISKIRYVGQAKDPYLRFVQHLGGGTSPRVRVWREEAIQSGFTPAMVCIEVCEQQHLTTRESFWINHYRALGMADLNSMIPVLRNAA